MNFQDFCYLPHVGFEGRNQAYGAYELRKKYSKTLSVTLLVVIFSSAAIFATPLIQRAFMPQEEKPIIQNIHTPIDSSVVIDLPKKDDIEKPKVVIPQPKVEVQIRTIQHQEINITDKPEKLLIETDKLKDMEVAISDKTKDGDAGNQEPEKVIVDDKGGEPTKGTGEEPKDNEVKEPYMVAQDATYEGGIDAFRDEIRKKVIYPRSAAAVGTEGKVYVQFVVEKDGSISNVKVIKDIGNGCGEATLQAFRKLHKSWAPARDAQGKAVRVRKTLPIEFKLNN